VGFIPEFEFDLTMSVAPAFSTQTRFIF